MAAVVKHHRHDKLWIGLIIGIVLPVILYFIIQPLKDFNNIIAVQENKIGLLIKILPKLLTKIVIPSGLSFFVFIYFKLDKIAKGVLIVTAAIALILIVMQLAS